MFAVLLISVLVPALALAQGTLTGTVTDAATGDALPGANVIIEGQPYGGATDLSGAYTIEGVPAGSYTVTASVIGYERISLTADVATGVTTTLNFELTGEALEMTALEVVASRATRETPVAYTDVAKEEMELRLGSRDIPMVLNTTPSVYATQTGGGAGDGRVNVRGFNQRNVAIMINGVPVNDMENGWVYWSNWDGVADATSSIQMQRGLSAVNLAAPSIGGTMNILTDPAARSAGGHLKTEFGDGGFFKATASYHSGLIADRLAIGATIVRKTGEGIIDKTWTDAWAYYFGASYAMSDKNRFEFYTLGAPQRHGQNRYMQNIAAYDSSFAKEIEDYDEGGIAEYPQSGRGNLYNENWNTVSSDYDGQQYFYMYGDKTVDRFNPNYLNERENYYHKPQVNLNWYYTINDMMRLSSIAYFSGGSGGGTGTFDDMQWVYGTEPSRIADWDATIATNEGTVNRKGNPKDAGLSVGFLRNSINRQWTIGAISKLNIDLSEALKVQAGIDWRTAEIEHTREVRDLLGGDYAVNGNYDPDSAAYSYFYSEFDETEADARVELGDFIDYNFTNTVDWMGFFGQAEYKTGLFSLYGMGGFSTVKYTFLDHFKKAENYEFDYIEAKDGGKVYIETDRIGAMQVKGGGLLKLTPDLDVFGNFGWVEKVPIFDNLIDDGAATLATDPSNEKFISFEGGVNLRALEGKLATKLNYYNTSWIDRNLTRAVNAGAGTSGDTDIIFLSGLDQKHTGIEAEISFQPMDMLRLDAAVSMGDWKYVGDAVGDYKEYETNTTVEYEYGVDGLYVGDMPQRSYILGASVFPISGLAISADFSMYDKFYADWNPADREINDWGADGLEDTDDAGEDDGVISDAERDLADREHSWQVPGFSVINLHGTYDLPIKVGGFSFQAFFHVFNALDATYISDALDNSQYNAYTDDVDPNDPTDDGYHHAADDAEVYLGLPRYMNFGVSVRF